MVLTREFRENILTHKEYKERLGYKFYIMTEDSVGIVLAKHLYRAKIIEKDGMLYWNLTRTGRLRRSLGLHSRCRNNLCPP